MHGGAHGFKALEFIAHQNQLSEIRYLWSGKLRNVCCSPKSLIVSIRDQIGLLTKLRGALYVRRFETLSVAALLQGVWRRRSVIWVFTT